MTSESNQGGIVYVFTNPAMPGLVKIGKTSRDSLKQRLEELSSPTGVPVPFECEYAARVSDDSAVERACHTAFGSHRINMDREFFRVAPEKVIEILKPWAIEDVTSSATRETTNITSVPKSPKGRRPNPDFLEMGIRVGSKLKFIDSGETVEVVSGNRLRYKGQIHSLTGMVNILQGKPATAGLSGRRTSYWSYKGKPLNEIYDETYGPRDS